jgi:hypothetical protein
MGLTHTADVGGDKMQKTQTRYIFVDEAEKRFIGAVARLMHTIDNAISLLERLDGDVLATKVDHHNIHDILLTCLDELKNACPGDCNLCTKNCEIECSIDCPECIRFFKCLSEGKLDIQPKLD